VPPHRREPTSSQLGACDAAPVSDWSRGSAAREAARLWRRATLDLGGSGAGCGSGAPAVHSAPRKGVRMSAPDQSSELKAGSGARARAEPAAASAAFAAGSAGRGNSAHDKVMGSALYRGASAYASIGSTARPCASPAAALEPLSRSSSTASLRSSGGGRGTGSTSAATASSGAPRSQPIPIAGSARNSRDSRPATSWGTPHHERASPRRQRAGDGMGEGFASVVARARGRLTGHHRPASSMESLAGSATDNSLTASAEGVSAAPLSRVQGASMLFALSGASFATALLSLGCPTCTDKLSLPVPLCAA
jgi:hypothetical protein